MNSDFNINTIIEKLIITRPIFTSEADFQLALAHAIEDVYKENATVRLEYCPSFENNKHLDILVLWTENDQTKWIPIELKYKTKEFVYKDSDNCVYNLKTQSAYDCGCYDYFHDISRIELIRKNARINEISFDKGYAIFLTNDKNYFEGEQSKTNKYRNFQIKNNRKIEKNKDYNWEDNPVLDEERVASIHIDGEYTFNWSNYSSITYTDKDIPKSTEFKILITEIK